MDYGTPTTYTTALGLWRRSGAVHVLSVHDTKIASFPMSFLHSCGDNTWDYILRVVSLLVELDAKHSPQLLDDSGNHVDIDQLPVSGSYRYVEQGQ